MTVSAWIEKNPVMLNCSKEAFDMCNIRGSAFTAH
jgi:hypothetical protein